MAGVCGGYVIICGSDEARNQVIMLRRMYPASITVFAVALGFSLPAYSGPDPRSAAEKIFNDSISIANMASLPDPAAVGALMGIRFEPEIRTDNNYTCINPAVIEEHVLTRHIINQNYDGLDVVTAPFGGSLSPIDTSKPTIRLLTNKRQRCSSIQQGEVATAMELTFSWLNTRGCVSGSEVMARLPEAEYRSLVARGITPSYIFYTTPDSSLRNSMQIYMSGGGARPEEQCIESIIINQFGVK